MKLNWRMAWYLFWFIAGMAIGTYIDKYEPQTCTTLSVQDCETAYYDSVVSSDDIIYLSPHTDTSEPVCPYCGEVNNHEGFYSYDTIVSNKHYEIARQNDFFYSIPDYCNPDFCRCNKCGKDFTISERYLTKSIGEIEYQSKELVYTTKKVD